jgi:hypothetical protein
VNEPLILVQWHDAWFDVDITTETERRTDYLVDTVGYRIALDDRYLHLAQERLPDDEGWRAVTHIPIVVIENIIELVPLASLNGERASVVG